MKTVLKNNESDMKLKLLALWIFVFLNMIFRDLHEFGRPGFLQEMITGVVNGVQITDSLLLIGGLMIEITALSLIIWYAWRWSSTSVAIESNKPC